MGTIYDIDPKYYEKFLIKVQDDLVKLQAQNASASTDSDKLAINNTLLLQLASLLKESIKLLVISVTPKNPQYVATHEKDTVSANTAVQLPDVAIPYGCAIVIRAKTTNGGTIYIGSGKAEAEDTTRSVPLASNDAQKYEIRNLSQLWFSSSVAGEGIIWTTETEEVVR